MKTATMVNIEGSNQTHVHLNNYSKESKISTTCARSTIIFSPKAGMTDEQLENLDNFDMQAVPEMYITKVGKDGKLNTEGFLMEE